MNVARAEALLAQRDSVWKVRTSLWMLAVPLGFGFLSVAGWAIAAAISKSNPIRIALAVYLVLTVVAFLMVTALDSQTVEGENLFDAGAMGDVALAIVVILWLVGTVHAAVMMRHVLRARVLHLESIGRGVGLAGETALGYGVAYGAGHHGAADHPGANPVGWGQQPRQVLDHLPSGLEDLHGALDSSGYRATDRPAAARPGPAAAQPGLDAGRGQSVGRMIDPGSPTQPRPAGTIDINRSEAAELASLPGMDQGAVDAILAARLRRGGFRDFDDLMASANLAPHVAARLRGAIHFGPFSMRTQVDRGRVIDI